MPRWIVKTAWALFAAVVLAMLLSPWAMAAPRARSAEECMVYADMALVAATLAKHGHSIERIDAMLPDMYNLSGADSKVLARMIVRAAAKFVEGKHGEPQNFLRMLGSACMMHRGNMDSVLGTST